MRWQPKKKMFIEDGPAVSTLRRERSAAPADSPEVLYRYYCDRIKVLQTQLSFLNLLEHPCEIQAVCEDVISLKKKIMVLAEKYKLLKNV